MDNILTPAEVAEKLKMSKAKIYLLIQRKELPHIRIGKNVRVWESDLKKWLDKQTEPAK